MPRLMLFNLIGHEHLQRVSYETLSRFYVKGHIDNYGKVALCYPRYRGEVFVILFTAVALAKFFFFEFVVHKVMACAKLV